MKTYTYSYQNGLCRGREAGEVPGQIRRRPQTPRGLGKCQTSCFKVSDASERPKQVVSRFPRPRKGSNKLFQGIRGLGKAQTSCFKVSDASERPKQVVSRNPRPRKGPNKLFQGFRRLGASTDAGESGRGVCGRRRIWPGTRRDPNARTTVGAYCIRPPNGPQGPNGTYPAGL